MPNLFAFKCPACGHDGEDFKVSGRAVFKVSIDGSAEQIGDIEWGSEDVCVCPICDKVATCGDFTEKCPDCQRPLTADDGGGQIYPEWFDYSCTNLQCSRVLKEERRYVDGQCELALE